MPVLLQQATQAGPDDFLILDCTHAQAEDLPRYVTVVTQTHLSVHIIDPSGDIVDALKPIARSPLVWLRADFGELMPPFTKLRMLKLMAAETRVAPHKPLTVRQQEVLALVVAGHSEAEAAHALNIGEGSVKSHVARIKEKLGLATLEELRVAHRRMTGG